MKLTTNLYFKKIWQPWYNFCSMNQTELNCQHVQEHKYILQTENFSNERLQVLSFPWKEISDWLTAVDVVIYIILKCNSSLIKSELEVNLFYGLENLHCPILIQCDLNPVPFWNISCVFSGSQVPSVWPSHLLIAGDEFSQF